LENSILLGLLGKLAPTLLLMVGEHGIKKLLKQSPIQRAIQATADVFPRIENINYALTKWCQSGEFDSLLKELKDGKRGLTDDSVVSSFIETGDFFAGEETETLAGKVLLAFFRKLEDELYKSDYGLSIHASRQEVLHTEIRTEIVKMRDEMCQRGQYVVEKLSEPLNQILKYLSSDDIEKSAETKEKTLHARVDEARTLIQRGKVISARSILERLRSETTNQFLSDNLRFRIATNLGACALELEDFETAKAEFQRALEYQPDNPKALTNAALAAILSGNLEKALKLGIRARELKQRDPHATSVYIETLHRLGRRKDIEELLLDEPWIIEDLTCSLVLGRIKCKEGKYEDAEVYLRKSIQGDSGNPDTYSLLALAILIPIQQALANDPPLQWRLAKETKSRLEEAEQALTRAIELLVEHENSAKLNLALVNRAAVRGMLGRFKDALEDCERVLLEDESHAIALQNKGLMLLNLNKESEAIDCFEKIERDDIQSAVALPLAHAYYEIGKPAKAIEILTQLWKPNSVERRQIQIADLLLRSYAKQGTTSACEEIVQSLAKTWPDNPDALSVIAHQQWREGKVDEAVDLLQEALTYSKGYQRDRITLALADLYYRHNKYAEAAEIYEIVVDKSRDNPSVRRYLVSLFNSGSYQKAFQLAKKIRGSGKAIPVVTEIEAQVLEYTGNIDEARELYLKLSEIEPDNVLHRVQIAFLDLRRGDSEEARQILSNIRIEEIKDPRLLMKVAQARALLGERDVLPLAYRARRLGFGDPQIHLAYIELFLSREVSDKLLLEPTEVGVDCTVYLKRDRETKVFTILDGHVVDQNKGELSLEDSLAQKLIGHRKGDRVTLKEGPLEELSYEIAEVQSKYVFAFQETLSIFSTLFPDYPGFNKVEIKDNDFSKLFVAVDARHKLISQVESLYLNKPLTLGAFAKLVGSSLVEIWGGMVGKVNSRIIASCGSVEETRREADLLSGTNRIVLDLTALLSVMYLDLDNQLKRRFKKIFIAQSVLDELNEALAKNYLLGRPSMTLGKEGDYYVSREITPESLKRGQEFLEKIREFVKSEAEIAAAESILKLGRERFEELKAVFGESSIASILVAKEQGIPLYSDDLRLRQRAWNDWKVGGVWSQTVLLSMQKQDLLTDDEYYDAIRKLVLANYYFVSIDAEGLLWILRRNHMSITREIEHIFQVLQGPDCDEESAVSVSADLIRSVWLEKTLYKQKLLILDLVLKSLTTRRLGIQVIEKLKAALQSRFVLMPLALQTIFKSIDIWKQQNLFRRGLLF
jgi:tetratricopeptide (TPR) repeat protein